MLGDYQAGDTLDFCFTTRNGGVPTTLAGSPALAVYKGNSLTQSTAGITLDVDFDGVTGLNHVRITTASDGAFYADGNDFSVVLTAGTVGGFSVVGVVVEDFSLAHRSVPTVDDTAAGVLDLTDGIETGLTLRQAIRLSVAALAGKLSGAATTTVTIRNAVADSKNRIVATVTADGNRTAVSTDLS